MTKTVGTCVSGVMTLSALAVCTLALLVPSCVHAQLFTFPKQDLIDYTAQNPIDLLPDGRPRVPDDLIERARGLSAEEVWAVLQQKEFNNQYADGFQVLRPGKTWSVECSLRSSCRCGPTLTMWRRPRPKNMVCSVSQIRLRSTCCSPAMSLLRTSSGRR